MSTTARQFLDEIAETLRAQGREVRITESDESFGTFVWLSSIAPSWYEATITLSARLGNRSKQRWALGNLEVRTSSGKVIKRATRTEIRIAAEVYA